MHKNATRDQLVLMAATCARHTLGWILAALVYCLVKG